MSLGDRLTEYRRDHGRNPGSEPWRPDDPLVGHQGYDGGYPADDGAGPHGSWQQYPQQATQGQPPYPSGDPYASGGWDTGHSQAHSQGYDQGAYGPHLHGQYGPGPADVYGTSAQHHPPPRPEAGREEPGPGPETGWDPGPDQGEADFFARRDGDDDGEVRGAGSRRRSDRRGGGPRRRRGGCACMVAALVLIGGGVAAGTYGYDFYQSRFGEVPDYAGQGRGGVQVTIPQGASLSDMGNLLKKAGVVASHDAFVAAAETHKAAHSIQPGVYTLRRAMSARAALAMLTDHSARNVLTVPEGLRATQIYALVDEKLGLAEGSTEKVAKDTDLGLPDWAKGTVEGFLFPSRYDVGEDTTAEDLLTAMVRRADAEFTEVGLESAAAEVDRSAYEILVIASLIQAEAQEAEDFGKVSRVIHNRLEQDMRLQFDSTINYALGRSTLDTSVDDTHLDSPYNTYQEWGLPPGPIDNPGHQAIEAALNPAKGDWLYFVTVGPGDTRFTDDPAVHDQNVADFNTAQVQGSGG